MTQARYLYAVTRGLSPEALEGVTGLGGAPVELVEHRGLAVLVSTVDLAEYGEEALRRNLEDLSWLETTARGHDDVVRFASARGATAPMRLVTICHDDEAVRARLDDSIEQIVQSLDRIEGRVEWSVKAFAPAAPAPERAPERATAMGPGGGSAYLRARKAAVEERRTQESTALETAAEVHETLSQIAVASRRMPPQDPRLSGYDGRMTLNAAYLIDEPDVEAFARAVERLADAYPEARLSTAGPWPPYSFATLEDE